MLNNSIVHETIVRDIIDLASGIKDSDEVQKFADYRNGTSFKSITSKSEALTLVFPVITSKNCSYDAAGMISKAIERKAVTMLHMLFAASNITNAIDGVDYLSRFHTNLKTNGSITVDDFIDTMDQLVDEAGLLTEAGELENYEAIKRDFRNLNFYLEDSTNEESLSSYKVINTESGNILVHEAKDDDEDPIDIELRRNVQRSTIDRNYSSIRNDQNNMNLSYYTQQKIEAELKKLGVDTKNAELSAQKMVADINKTAIDSANSRLTTEKIRGELKKLGIDTKNAELSAHKIVSDIEVAKTRNQAEIERIKNDMKNSQITRAKTLMDIERSRLLDTDVKKANELVPTMMTVNFTSIRNDQYPVVSTIVIGVKAKLYAVDSEDILNRIKIKHSSRNLMLNLIKVSTREISFFRDFIFALDKAKIDALSQSKRGSSNKIWKVLERRALKSKIRRSFFMTNDATAISTLVLSQEDVDYLRKTEYIDVEDPRVIRPILEAYNLMGFVIVDESLEIAKFIFDTGDDLYEVLTFSNLEREQKDNSKKIINLMSKMNR